MAEALVALVAGGRHELPALERAAEVLRSLEVPHTIDVRSPATDAAGLGRWAAELGDGAVEVVIVGDTGGLAALVASVTPLPVIAIPLATRSSGAGAALQATVRAPAGVPIAVVAADDGRSAAMLAGRILALARPDLRDRITALLGDDTELRPDHRAWPTTDEDRGTGFGFQPR